MSALRFGVREVSIQGFRSAVSVRFAPGPVCALVGGPSVGKSNVLAAVWMLLQRGLPAPTVGDLAAAPHGPARISATLSDGDEVWLEADGVGSASEGGPSVPVLYIPASLRSSRLVGEPLAPSAATERALAHLALDQSPSSAAPAAALVAWLERLCSETQGGLVLLIEEPELFLRPQAQRYLYRLLRRFAGNGNQVLYSTHEPAFLNVGRLGEIALVEHRPDAGTVVIHPEALPAEESFRAVSELDAERAELFLARAALLVEGRTEKLTLPFVFRALGHDVDREGVTIVDCGGKPNIPLFIRICEAARVPCVAIHDRDAPRGREPARSERILNAQIAELAGRSRTFELAPDFEAVAGLRGHRHKPAHAFERFSRIARRDVPRELTAAVGKTLALARAGSPSS